MPQFTGRFYFKLTSGGNLLGEYSNSLSMHSSTEAADRVAEAPNPADRQLSRFVADYISVWHESVSSFTHSTLVIRPKSECSGIFTVNWTGPAKFKGEAMLCDDVLIGDYRPA